MTENIGGFDSLRGSNFLLKLKELTLSATVIIEGEEKTGLETIKMYKDHIINSIYKGFAELGINSSQLNQTNVYIGLIEVPVYGADGSEIATLVVDYDYNDTRENKVEITLKAIKNFGEIDSQA